MKSKLKILIAPGDAAADRRVVAGLESGFRLVGQDAKALATPVESASLADLCDRDSIDVVIQVNRSRNPNVQLPKHVRHIAWYQDVFPTTLEGFTEGFRSGDILYALGDPVVLGLNVQVPCLVETLYTGVDEDAITGPLDDRRKLQDFSLCGYIPPPLIKSPNIANKTLSYWDRLNASLTAPTRSESLWLLRKILFKNYLPADYLPFRAICALSEIVESDYQPLSGNLDIHRLTARMRQFFTDESRRMSVPQFAFEMSGNGRKLPTVLRCYALLGGARAKSVIAQYVNERSSMSQVDRAMNYFAREYPRLLDRRKMLNEVLKISSSLKLFGPGWNQHVEYAPYAGGIIRDAQRLFNVYRESRINLANNTHGVGLHSRTLECMAVGGFILMHQSPHDEKPGGIQTSFIPGVHYGQFSPQNLREEALRWLANPSGRQQAGLRAVAVIRAKHCWRHRAEQILRDLQR